MVGKESRPGDWNLKVVFDSVHLAWLFQKTLGFFPALELFLPQESPALPPVMMMCYFPEFVPLKKGVGNLTFITYIGNRTEIYFKFNLGGGTKIWN